MRQVGEGVEHTSSAGLDGRSLPQSDLVVETAPAVGPRRVQVLAELSALRPVSCWARFSALPLSHTRVTYPSQCFPDVSSTGITTRPAYFPRGARPSPVRSMRSGVTPRDAR